MHLYDIVTIPTLKGRHPNHFKIKIINPESNIHASTVMTSCNTYKAYRTNHNLGRPQMWMFEVPALQEITQPKPRKHQIHRTSTLYNLWVYPILRYTLRMEIWPPGLQPDCTGAGNEDRHGRSQCWRKATRTGVDPMEVWKTNDGYFDGPASRFKLTHETWFSETISAWFTVYMKKRRA